MSNAHDKRSPRVGRGLKRGWEKIQLDRVLSDTLRPLTICVSPRGLLFTLISYPSFSTNLVPLCLFIPLFLRLPLALVFSFSLCLMLSSFCFLRPVLLLFLSNLKLVLSLAILCNLSEVSFLTLASGLQRVWNCYECSVYRSDTSSLREG